MTVDEGWMREALAEARRGLGRTSPNPAVGALVVEDGEIVARGFHAKAGDDHAEVSALRKLDFAAEGADLYSTLEPCDHHGRTGPCTEAIIRSGIRRVVVGAIDPNPVVSGRGVARLRAAGIEVVSGVLGDECTRLNEAYNFAIQTKSPFVVLKVACSLDGRIATRTGHSQWITGEVAREEARRLRDVLDAVLVGANTVIADDPSLTVRIPDARDPIRVVLDSRLRIPESSKIVHTARQVRTIVATTAAAPARKQKRLEARGVEVLSLKKTRDGRVDLPALLEALYNRDVIGLLVEGGASVHGAFVDARLVQKVALFLAPILIGGEGAPPSIAGRGARRLEDALSLEHLEAKPIGRDLMLTAYVRES